MTGTGRPTSPGAEEILGLYFPVLDHGFVSLVDYMGTDECIERAARVSYGYGTRKAQLTRGLLRYLRRHLHTTPTEMVELKFHCCMPMFVARQWIRHRTACLAGDALLYFDLPGAEKRGRRQRHNVSIADFHRMWTQGTEHPTGALRQPTVRVDMRARLSAMRLRSCDERTGEILHTNVTDVWESGVKPVFRVTLENGYSLKMSKDHRCLTERGWLTLAEATGLRRSERGGVTWRADAPAFSVNGAPAYRDREWLRARRAEGLSIDEIAARAEISYHSVRKYLKRYGLGYSPREKARLSGLTQRGQRRAPSGRRTLTPEHLAIIRRARSGPASNFWKGGASTDRENVGRWTTQVAARVHARCGHSCAVCGSKKRLHAHHVDPVWHNPTRARDEENLISLCRRCHDRLHADNLELALLEAASSGAELHDFWRGRERQPRPETKPRPAPTRLVRQFSRVARIEYVGDEMTYDLEVAGPYHNFVANGFVVHNSVNEYSGRYSLMPMLFYTPSEEQLQTQSAQNNQGRSGQSVSAEKYAEATARWNEIRRLSQSAYEWMTNQEMARELARIDLPLSTYTQWYWKIDLHNLQHFLKLR
ncbi:MAG: FAD-dependent thymidylate synthase, partial [Polyangiaceae bacterium]|nr:FAD-dependent thymidylate synthase [Polyangiaceae bacterium]